jgi:hypothetical protein
VQVVRGRTPDSYVDFTAILPGSHRVRARVVFLDPAEDGINEVLWTDEQSFWVMTPFSVQHLSVFVCR